MQTHWKRVLLKTFVWLVAEIILNIFNLDTIVDCGEFISEWNVKPVTAHRPEITMIAAPSCPWIAGLL
jgi:hypothetical protein